MITRTRARLFAAIATGLAGCHPETTSPPNDSNVVIPPPASASTPSPTPTPIPTPPPTPRVGALRCAPPDKVDRLCVPRNTVPSTGGNVLPAPYSSWDKNGCYQANEIVGSCNGIRDAVGPFVNGSQCCFDVCEGTPAPCGRPLTIDGSARIAAATTSADWRASRMSLSTHHAAALAWQGDAIMEHASIASFARLSLELMAVGAPASLVASTHRAALDEVEHARTCFAIASALGARGPLGASELSLAGLTIERDLASIARRAAVEGCVGETVAALALSRAAELCSDEALRAALTKMAEDELSHAALAWELVAWACARGGRDVRSAVASALEVADYEAPSMDGAAWNQAGRLTHAQLRDVTRDARALVAEARDRLLSRRAQRGHEH